MSTVMNEIFLNAYNSDNVIVMSKISHSNVQNFSSCNTLVALKKVIDTESSGSINDEKTD